jgi:hypothetical protein
MSAVWYFSALSVLTHPTYSFSPSIGSAIPYSGAERASLSPVWLQAKPSYINMIDSNSDHLEESYSHASIDRRVFVQWGAVTTALLIGGAVAPAIADVSDGTALPEGAAQFGRVVRTKLDLGVSVFACSFLWIVGLFVSPGVSNASNTSICQLTNKHHQSIMPNLLTVLLLHSQTTCSDKR